MSNIFKAFKLDMITVRKSSRTYIMFLILAAIFLIAGQSTFGISYLFLITIIITTSPFANESNTNLSKFSLSLPLKKSELVGGRYLFLILVLAIAWLFASVAIAIEYSMNMLTVIEAIQCILTGLLLSVAAMIQFPLYYKFGIQKGRILSMLVYIIPIIMSFAIPEIIVDAGGHFISNPNMILIICSTIIVLFVALFISYKLSERIFLKKEL